MTLDLDTGTHSKVKGRAVGHREQRGDPALAQECAELNISDQNKKLKGIKKEVYK